MALNHRYAFALSLLDDKCEASDEEYTRLVAILHLAAPYTGLIMTAREPT